MKYKILVLSILFLGALVSLFGQCDNAPKLPSMLVIKNVALPAVIQFTQGKPSKYELLRKLNGFQNFSFTYTRKAIDKLLLIINKDKGIRIYFARYNQCDDIASNFPTTLEDNKVILLFTKEGDYKHFFYLNENDDKVYEVFETCATDWINDFENNVASQLLKTVVRRDQDNFDPRTKKFSDTKSIFYPKDSIEQAITTEESYSHVLDKDSIEITGYRVYFSTYPKKGKKPKPWERGVPSWKQRLFLQFDYLFDDVDGNKEVFYLEDLSDFECRLNNSLKQAYSLKDKDLKNLTLEKKLAITSIDNGQLCPTNCPKP